MLKFLSSIVHEHVGLLSDTELDAFATACNGRPFDKAAKEEIK